MDILSIDEESVLSQVEQSLFYEKLLKIKDTINTDEGKKIAKARTDFMQAYLNEFYEEWNGNK